MFEYDEPVMFVSRVVAHLASILLLPQPLPSFLADPQELDLLPGKIATTVPCVFGKYAHLLLVRAVGFVFAH